MDAEQIERAERTARRLDQRVGRVPKDTKVLALAEAQGWERPKSLAEGKRKPIAERNYEFTERQLEIALQALEKQAG